MPLSGSGHKWERASKRERARAVRQAGASGPTAARRTGLYRGRRSAGAAAVARGVAAVSTHTLLRGRPSTHTLLRGEDTRLTIQPRSLEAWLRCAEYSHHAEGVRVACVGPGPTQLCRCALLPAAAQTHSSTNTHNHSQTLTNTHRFTHRLTLKLTQTHTNSHNLTQSHTDSHRHKRKHTHTHTHTHT